MQGGLSDSIQYVNDIILYQGKSVPLRVHDQESHIGILGCFPTYKGNK